MDPTWIVDRALKLAWFGARRVLCVVYGYKFCRFAPKSSRVPGAKAEQSSFYVTHAHRRGLLDL